VEEEILAAVLTGLPIAAWGANAVRRSSQRKHRLAALEEFARKRGFTFEPRIESTIPPELEIFQAIDPVARPSLANRMAGADSGLPVHVFDLRMGNRYGHHRLTLAQTVVDLVSPKLNLPVFRIEPENVLHKVQEAMGAQDIDFESHPKFSDKYLLRGESEEAIRRVFQPAVLDWFERHLGLTVEGRAERLLLYRSGKLLGPPQIDEHLKLAREISDLFR
jgi:hypothetical protein